MGNDQPPLMTSRGRANSFHWPLRTAAPSMKGSTFSSTVSKSRTRKPAVSGRPLRAPASGLASVGHCFDDVEEDVVVVVGGGGGRATVCATVADASAYSLPLPLSGAPLKSLLLLLVVVLTPTLLSASRAATMRDVRSRPSSIGRDASRRTSTLRRNATTTTRQEGWQMQRQWRLG